MDNRFRGTVPRRGDILDPGAEVFELDHDSAARRAGAYMEVDLKPVHAVAVNAGLRADHHDPAGAGRRGWTCSSSTVASADPRERLGGVQLSRDSQIRALRMIGVGGTGSVSPPS